MCTFIYVSIRSGNPYRFRTIPPLSLLMYVPRAPFAIASHGRYGKKNHFTTPRDHRGTHIGLYINILYRCLVDGCRDRVCVGGTRPGAMLTKTLHAYYNIMYRVMCCIDVSSIRGYIPRYTSGRFPSTQHKH